VTDEAWAALMRIMSPYSRRNIELLEGVDLHQPEPGAADRVQAAIDVVSVHGGHFVDGGDE